MLASRRTFQAAMRHRAAPLNQRIAHYYVKPKKKKGASTQAWVALAGLSATLTGVGVCFLGRPEEQIAGLEAEPDKYANGRENVVKAYLLRTWDRIVEFRRSFVDPSSERLLPDMLPPPYQRPYTLIIEMNNVLIHSEYDRNVGWKYQKRPGVDALLMQLFDFYEIVIFTSENAITANPIVTAMDPNQFVLYSLYRDSTKYVDGHHVKDLANLNRPLTKVVVVDTDSKSVKYHPGNSIILDKWTGDILDRTLLDLIPFLLTIAVNDVDDVRPVLDYYKSQGSGNVLETFKENQERLKAEEEMEKERMASQRGSSHRLGSAIPTFNFGRFSKNVQSTELPAEHKPTQAPEPSESQPPAQSGEDSDSAWSMTKWIGSWLGWK